MTTKKQTVVVADLDSLMSDMLAVASNHTVQYHTLANASFAEVQAEKNADKKAEKVKEFDRLANRATTGAMQVAKTITSIKTQEINLRKLVVTETKLAADSKIATLQDTVKQLSAGGAGETKAAGVTPRARKPKTSDAPVAPETK